MTPEQTAASVKPALLGIVGVFTESPQTLRRARLLGLSGWAYHVAARAGVLGDVRPETVAAIIGFVAPDAVSDGWEAAAKMMPPMAVAQTHLDELCRWGVDHLGGFPRLGRLVELTRTVAQNADAAGFPLFAAWRAMPIPDESPGAQAAVQLFLLHELLRGAQVITVRASGLSPLEAIIASPEGETGAVAFGWQPPYPATGPLLRRVMWAEAVGDSLLGQAYAHLDRSARIELIGLLDSLAARIVGG